MYECLLVCMCTTYVQCHRVQRKVLGPVELEVQPCRCWEPTQILYKSHVSSPSSPIHKAVYRQQIQGDIS